MTASYSFPVCHLSRMRWTIRVVCLVVFLAGLAVSPSPASEQQLDGTINRLEFRVVDVKADGQPVQSFRYSFELYSAHEEMLSKQLDVAYRSEDAVLRIPKPFPPFGRIRVWIDADDLERGYRHGYGSFSYEIDTEKASVPTIIQLEPGIVLTGKVLDAENGKPIPGAEVAPMKWGHHFNWADWAESAKTDREGKYRITTSSAEGIAAKHRDYREGELDEWDFAPGHNISNKKVSTRAQQEIGADGIVFRLHRLIPLRGRVVDPDGEPIAGASVTNSTRDSDASGRFRMKVTREEWEHREEHEIRFYARYYHLRKVPLKDFSLDQETVIALEREQLIQGQILDENGNPLEDCTVQLKSESEYVRSSFKTVPGPYKQGKWQSHIGEYDRVVTLRVSVGGSIRSLKRYTLEEVTSGPIITRLGESHRLTAKLVATVPLDETNTPVVLLSSMENDELEQRARVQEDGSVTFSGLADGQYTFALYPALSTQHRGGEMNGGIGGFTTFGFTSRNKPQEKSITISGSDLELDPINLHDAGVLPGRVTGVAFNPNAANEPFANAFGYICSGEDDFDTVGGSYYLLRFMTDAAGRFRIDPCPPGQYVLRLTNDAHGYGPYDPSVWIRVVPEKTIDLRLFAPEAAHRLAINFVVGNGSSRDVHAGVALDEGVIAKHMDSKTGRLPHIADTNERLRAKASKIHCQLQPLDQTATHWPIYVERFEFSPRNLLKNNPRDIVIPNVTPGRWQLTLRATYSAVYTSSETALTRDYEFTEGMAPLQIAFPPAAVAGTFDYPGRGVWGRAKIEAIPQDPGLPTRTCRGETSFRLVGLAPGKYLLRFQARGCETKYVENVVVRKGDTTWLDRVVLKRAEPKKAPTPERQRATQQGTPKTNG